MTAALHRATPTLDDAGAIVRERIGEAADLLAAFGVPRFDLGGSMLRPLVAYALGGRALEPSTAPRFWSAALAVQLAHEASLLHDDVIDNAPTRRGVATLAAARGSGAALLIGDHALTAAYRAATMSADITFVSMFARAVERTVAGEREQASTAGATLDLARYRGIMIGKSGELFGCAAAIGPTLLGRRDATRWLELGRRVGLVYQMLDDLLDYCPSTDAGKPTLSDSAQGRWTWPLALLATDDGTARARDDGFRPHTPELVADALFREIGTAVSPARRALGMLDAEIDALVIELNAASSDTLILALLERWRQTAHAAIRTEESRRRASRRPRSTTRIITAPEPNDVGRFMSRHSRSFRFATLLLPSAQRRQIERVYAWCRYTDDIVDRVPAGDPGAIAEAEARLDAWIALSRTAYGGEPSGIALIDAVMGDMARHAIPFSYANLLAEGVRMDLRPREYRSMSDLREYTHRVASVVGLWLCELHSVTDAAMLDRAAALGHAMQITNILRDVGEDLGQGRLYLPLDRLARHGLERADLDAMRNDSQPIGPAYCAVIEEMIGVAETSYRHAGEAIAALPLAFGRSVAVAAAVYAKIHDRIRANGYDNLRRRAYTTSIDKVVAGTRALFVLRAPRPVMRQANPLRTNG